MAGNRQLETFPLKERALTYWLVATRGGWGVKREAQVSISRQIWREGKREGGRMEGGREGEVDVFSLNKHSNVSLHRV